jgi:uncharacterized membrane protein YedE/YeeE
VGRVFRSVFNRVLEKNKLVETFRLSLIRITIFISILGNELARQSRLILFILIIGSIILLLIIISGAPLYYYKYGRGDTKASISKNPNYGLSTSILFFI